MLKKSAVTGVKIHEIIQNRWSPRAFDADKAVKHEDLLALLEAARWAPSCFNDQPWRFVVSNKSDNEAAWANALTTIVEKNRLWAKNAPVLILVGAMENFRHNEQPNRWAGYDAGAASVSLCLQASALGLIAHQMGGFNAEKAREVFNLPADFNPIAMIAVGYQAEVDVLDESFKEAEASARSRLPLNEVFYAGQWGKGVE